MTSECKFDIMLCQVIGEKGVNNVISCEYEHHVNQGTGAKRANVWFDRCMGQCNNWTLCQYHVHITDEDSGMFMHERLDEKTPYSGHSFLENDREYGNIQQAARAVPTISDYNDWMDIARRANKKNPNRVVHLTQEYHYDFQKFLSQYYIASRKEYVGGENVTIMDAVWRNYGMGEELVDPGDGSEPRVELVAHPGEVVIFRYDMDMTYCRCAQVWLRYTHDVTEPWTKIDMRRRAKKKHQGQYSRNEEGVWSCIRTKVSQ